MKSKIIKGDENSREELFDWFDRQLVDVFENETGRALFLLAFVEAVNNAAGHGNDGDTTKQIIISYFLAKEFAWISVEDEGVGYEPIFPDLKQVIGPHGRGLGFIKSNTDAVFFSRRGNRITFIKGGETVKTFGNIDATLTIFANGTALVTDLRAKGKGQFKVHDGLSEIFEFCDKRVENFYFDLRNITIFNSQTWGLFFAEAGKNEIKLLQFFNTNETIQTSAKQLGIGKRQDVYGKIKISADNEEAQQILKM